MSASFLASLPAFDAFAGLAAAALLCYAPHCLKIYAIVRKTGRYSLRNPRETVAKSVAEIGAEKPEARLIARLQSCHEHHLEVFPIIATSVLMAVAAGVDRRSTDAATTLIVLLRGVHFAAYAAGASSVRAGAFLLTGVPVAFLMSSAAGLRMKASA
jgi:uncharacterized MAPEG superfamily protein